MAYRSVTGEVIRISRVVTTWQEAELLARDAMVQLGHGEAQLTAPGRDNGIDVVARGAVAQVKNHSVPIGSPDVQRLKGAAENREAFFFARAGFTPRAVLFADRNHVRLFRYDSNGLVTPENGRAELLLVELSSRHPEPNAKERELAHRLEKTGQNLTAVGREAVLRAGSTTWRDRRAVSRVQRLLQEVLRAHTTLQALADRDAKGLRPVERQIRVIEGKLAEAARLLGMRLR